MFASAGGSKHDGNGGGGGALNNAQSPRVEMRGDGRRRAFLAAVIIAIMLVGLWASLLSVAAPVSFTVPFSPVAISDADLEGDPATGAWGDALSVGIPLENGQSAPYGTATLYAKHDGSNVYLRIDGSIDVSWLSATGDHFWLGVQVSPRHISHHGGSEWDGTFFGLWNGDEYAPQPTYPPRAVDTNGFDRPPVMDLLQNVFGAMRYTGSAAPYSFTAEWKRPLDSEDTDDLSYQADGITTYNFFVTTDSDGRGSSGGGVSHSRVTNLNVMKIATSESKIIPPTIEHSPPPAVLVGKNIPLSANVVDVEGVAEVRVNYTDVLGERANETMVLLGTVYAYTIPAQDRSGTVEYFLWAVDMSGNEARTAVYTISVRELHSPPTMRSVVADAIGCLRITWDAVPDADLAGYRLYRWNTSSESMEEITVLAPDETSYQDCSLEADRTYTYWLIASYESGDESPPSIMVNGRTAEMAEAEADLLVYQVALAIVAALAAVIVLLVVLRRRPPEREGDGGNLM